MATKNIKFYYYSPVRVITKIKQREQILPFNDFSKVLNHIYSIDLKERVKNLGEGDILQLKSITKPSNLNNKWELCFLKNTTETSFKNKIDEEITEAETLEENEFLGQETCCLYDATVNVLAIQSNAKSIAPHYIAQFFEQYMENVCIRLNCIISEFSNEITEVTDECRTFSIGVTDITKFQKELESLEKTDDLEVIKRLCAAAQQLETNNFKYEFSVGRISKKSDKKTLNCATVQNIVDKVRAFKSINNLKIKINEDGSIKLIDLIQNKVYGEFSIVVSKNDPKTFDKILNPMNIKFQEEIDSCTFPILKA